MAEYYHEEHEGHEKQKKRALLRAFRVLRGEQSVIIRIAANLWTVPKKATQHNRGYG